MKPITLSRGFTLAELAVVLVIVGLLLGGLFMPLSAQMNSRNTNDTQKTLNDIRDALLGFAAANGRLPCPALATISDTTAGAGLESPQGGPCANSAGVLPWVTLGVPETDAWGNRFTYRVTLDFARVANGQNTYSSTAGTCITNNNPPTNPPINPQFAAFALCSQGDMTIVNTTVGSSSPISTNIPAVVISHGKNGNGAFTSQGTPLSPGGDQDEISNRLIQPNGIATAVGNNFVSKTPTPTFDDIVMSISSNLLFNRMIAAGKLP